MSIINKIKNKRCLWVDDDPRERFVYEEYILKQRDEWNIDWARNMMCAVDFLREKEFNAVILDQMIPLEDGNMPDIWGGCLLLYWLRGRISSSENDFLPEVRTENWNQLLKLNPPLPENKTVEVIVLSAFHEQYILEATKHASEQDKNISFLSKPVDLKSLQYHLGRTIGIRDYA